MLRRVIFGCVLLLALVAPVHAAQARELIICGADEVSILRVDASTQVKVWRWKASARAEMPYAIRRRFYYTADCKPVDGGKRILIVTSGGAVALVERKTGRALFWAGAPYAHSAEMLPGNRIVVACASRANRLALFDVAVPEKEVFTCPLPGAHGVVWDEKRQFLWALDDTDLRTYRLVDWDSDHPSLSPADAYKLPKIGGHDLSPVPGSNDLTVTANSQSWYFDRDKREFRPLAEIPKSWSIKSISIDPLTHELAYVQAEGRNWWAESVHILPDRTIHLLGQHIYKARWNTGK
jgi:hypothetical protein